MEKDPLEGNTYIVSRENIKGKWNPTLLRCFVTSFINFKLVTRKEQRSLAKSACIPDYLQISEGLGVAELRFWMTPNFAL